MDGTQKLPQRLLDSLLWHRRNGSDCRCLILAVAGWMRYVSSIDDKSNPIDIHDPLASVLHDIVLATPDGAERVRGLLTMSSVFDPELVTDAPLVHALTEAYLSLRDKGANATVTQLADTLFAR